MKKLIGLVAVLAVLGAVVASSASAEEATSQTPPAATEGSEPPAGSESPVTPAIGVCGVGSICVYVLPYFEGPGGLTNCQAPGAHPLGGNRNSIQNECEHVAVWMRVNGNAVGCKNPETSNNNIVFNELWVGQNGSHC
jgi:hypothetical protein